MKRVAHLFDAIANVENLRLAFYKAARGKRDRAAVRRFEERLPAQLEQVVAQLHLRTFMFGRYRQFLIRDPKQRLITAPCFEERVLHHGILNGCESHFERGLVADSIACRRDKGREAAIRRTRQFAQKFPLFLKLDVRNYFHCIDHACLLAQLERKFKDRQLVQLWADLVHAYPGSEGRGLPIGSLTSQHLANFYLGHLDRFVK